MYNTEPQAAAITWTHTKPVKEPLRKKIKNSLQATMPNYFKPKRIKTQDSRQFYFLPETSVTVKWEDSSKTKNVASEEPPKKKI